MQGLRIFLLLAVLLTIARSGQAECNSSKRGSWLTPKIVRVERGRDCEYQCIHHCQYLKRQDCECGRYETTFRGDCLCSCICT